MRYHEIAKPIMEKLMVGSPQFAQWFSGSKVVDANGYPLPVYHGTSRPDRVGTRFRKSRATAGPMVYFTDDPTIASNYATGKSDTSLNDDTNYENWFKIKVGRSEVNIVQAWYFLDQAQKNKIAELAPHIRRDEDGIIIYDEDNARGNGSYDYGLKQARGNVLKALVEDWLNSGVLFGDEYDFLKVLKMAGLDVPVKYDDPNAAYPFVYSVYLSIKNPLISTAIPQSVIDALVKEAAKKRSKPNPYGEQQWEKNRQDARSWVNSLLDDIKNTGGRLSWTVIPDWVTNVLKQMGYDGIKDVGGKNGGDGHTVWIPFEEHQVKSAISNKKYNPSKKGIHESSLMEPVEIIKTMNFDS